MFDSSIEGTPVLNDLELYVSAPGKWVAYDQALSVTVTGGQLNMAFAASVTNPLLNGLVALGD